MISQARNTRSYTPTRYPDGAARSHGFGTPNRTCLEGIRKGLHDLTGKEHQITTAYEITGPGGRVSRVRDTRSNMPMRYQNGAAGSYGFEPIDSRCLQGIRSGLQDFTGKAHQIEPAYTVSGQGCRILLVGNYRSYMPTRHQEHTSGSHGFETPDRTCLLGVRRALHDLTGSEEKIIHTYKLRHIRSNVPITCQDGVA